MQLFFSNNWLVDIYQRYFSELYTFSYVVDDHRGKSLKDSLLEIFVEWELNQE